MANKYTPNNDYNNKTKLKDWWPIIQENINKIFNLFNGHIAGTQDKHGAADINYGDGTVEAGLDGIKEKVETHKADTEVHITSTERTNWNDAVSHISNTLNPHGVTKAQVGLGNVDNTSDLNKPISTATQKALDELESMIENSGGDGSQTADGGFIGGEDASATSGGAVGYYANSTSGGAVGNGAKAIDGGAIGGGTETEQGGAVGYYASSVSGFAGGEDASTNNGGAIGQNSNATDGGAVGYEAATETGGAVGDSSSSTTGGAVGQGAKTTKGFAGGYNAKTLYYPDEYEDYEELIDAIQLGTGTNSESKTLQVYNYQLMGADGNIPVERLNTATNNQTPTYTVASTLTALISGEKLSVAFGKISKAISDFITHVSDTVKHLTNTERTNWNDANSKKHEHGNKSVLDGITSALITAWNNAVTHTTDTTTHITSAERTNWNDANSKKHSHSNKSVLDGITSALITAWNNAVTHISDTVKHLTSAERTNWNAAYTHSQAEHAPLANIKKNPNYTTGDIIGTHLTVGNSGLMGARSFSSGGDEDSEGNSNIAGANDSATVGGYLNKVESTAYGSVILGGWDNTITPSFSAIMGGGSNQIGEKCYNSAIIGGENNELVGDADYMPVRGVIVGGQNNQIEGDGRNSVILGGQHNHIFNTNTAESSAIIGGYHALANDYNTAVGRYNIDPSAPLSATDTSGDVFVVGIGTPSARKNGFRVAYDGNCYAATAMNSTGADYAECFEWIDGNPENEDRVGLMTAFEGTKIRFANADDPIEIIGIVSAIPAVVGDNYADEWCGKYQKDKYGRMITEHKVYAEVLDDEGNVIKSAYEADEYVLNPDYKPDEKYIPRLERAEYDAVGTHGKLVVRDDGSCEVGGFCRSGENGIATASESGFYVMERIDDETIRVYIK